MIDEFLSTYSDGSDLLTDEETAEYGEVIDTLEDKDSDEYCEILGARHYQNLAGVDHCKSMESSHRITNIYASISFDQPETERRELSPS